MLRPLLKHARWHHVVAMLVGVVFFGYLQWTDPPGTPHAGGPVTVVLASIVFGLLWECILRLWLLVTTGRLTRE